MNQGFKKQKVWGDGNKNDREVTSKNSFLHESNENTGKSSESAFFRLWILTKGFQQSEEC